MAVELMYRIIETQHCAIQRRRAEFVMNSALLRLFGAVLFSSRLTNENAKQGLPVDGRSVSDDCFRTEAQIVVERYGRQ